MKVHSPLQTVERSPDQEGWAKGHLCSSVGQGLQMDVYCSMLCCHLETRSATFYFV